MRDEPHTHELDSNWSQKAGASFEEMRLVRGACKNAKPWKTDLQLFSPTLAKPVQTRCVSGNTNARGDGRSAQSPNPRSAARLFESRIFAFPKPGWGTTLSDCSLATNAAVRAWQSDSLRVLHYRISRGFLRGFSSPAMRNHQPEFRTNGYLLVDATSSCFLCKPGGERKASGRCAGRRTSCSPPARGECS